MNHKLLQPTELTEAEIDVVSGGHFVGIRQSNGSNESGRQTIKTTSGGTGAATTTNAYNSVYQSNYNSGSVTNNGALSGG